MKLVTFSAGSGQRVGVVDTDANVVHDVGALLPAGTGLLEVIEGWAGYEAALVDGYAGQPQHALDAVQLHAPIPVPRRNIFCVGKNYRDHVVEFGRSGYDQPDRSEALPEHPVVFAKATTSVTGPFGDIESHPGVTAEGYSRRRDHDFAKCDRENV